MAARDGVDGVGVAQHPELVAHAVVVVDVADRLVVGRVEGGRDAVGHGEAPDGREVGPCGAQQVQAVALRLGQRLLVGEDVALLARVGQAEQPDDTGRGAARRVGHAVGVEARLRVGGEDALVEPAVEEVGGHRVAVPPAAEVRLGQFDEDGVGLVYARPDAPARSTRSRRRAGR